LLREYGAFAGASDGFAASLFVCGSPKSGDSKSCTAVLRGITRDRLDLLGEEEFQYNLKPLLKEEGVKKLKALRDSGAEVVLVSQGLEHVMRPLARHLGVRWIIANRLEFRDGVTTGRLLGPVIRREDCFARIREAGPDGQQSTARWVRPWACADWRALGSSDCSGGSGKCRCGRVRLCISTRRRQ